MSIQSPNEDKAAENKDDFLTALTKVLSHPLAAGLGGFLVGQYSRSEKKEPALNETGQESEIWKLKKEIRELRKQMESLKQEPQVPKWPPPTIPKEEPLSKQNFRFSQLD